MGWLADETGLDKQPANHLPLTPLSHLIGPGPLPPANGACVRANPPDLRRVSRALHPVGRSAGRPGDQARRCGRHDPAEPTRAGRSPLGRASLWCRAQHDQHAPRSGDGALYLRARWRKDRAVRHRPSAWPKRPSQMAGPPPKSSKCPTRLPVLAASGRATPL